MTTTPTRTSAGITTGSGVRCLDAWQGMWMSTPTDDELDAAAENLIISLSTILYMEEMAETLAVRDRRSRRLQRTRIRNLYKQWVDIETVDETHGWTDWR